MQRLIFSDSAIRPQGGGWGVSQGYGSPEPHFKCGGPRVKVLQLAFMDQKHTSDVSLDDNRHEASQVSELVAGLLQSERT